MDRVFRYDPEATTVVRMLQPDWVCIMETSGAKFSLTIFSLQYISSLIDELETGDTVSRD